MSDDEKDLWERQIRINALQSKSNLIQNLINVIMVVLLIILLLLRAFA